MSYPPPPPPRPAGPATAIVTPEAVPLDFELANLGSRSVALFLDLLIVGAALFVVSIGMSAILSGVDAPVGVGAALFFLIFFLVFFGYPIALETLWRGRTVGKAALGLRVVTKEGAPVRFRHAAIRTALGIVDFGLTLGSAAIISVLTTHDNQRLGDLVAGTIVLRERSGLRAPAPVGFYVPPGLEPYAGALDLAGLTGQDYEAVRMFLVRAPSLPHDVRANLAVQIANPLAARVRPPPPQGTFPEAFLACLAAVYQHRQRALAPLPPPPPAPAPPLPSPPARPTPGSSNEGGFSPPT
ncbi:MAG: RDD family protein [Actinomycetota bacterium]|nr:RDD family protein [Actinomycetota bacterium]